MNNTPNHHLHHAQLTFHSLTFNSQTLKLIYLLLPLALALAALSLVSCASPSPRIINTPIHEGMTGAELQSTFGRPLQIERQPDGGEDWFYNFGTQGRESQPISESVVSGNQHSYSYGHSTTTTTTMTRLPVHLSPTGRVIDPIPAGSIIVE